ncbi:MAG: hypothetical protein MJ221_02925 [Bacilli bacterium]|nr:hypothetical protein [Bacilli bacterium]
MKTIIFICHGNICRSIAAECIANKILIDKGITNIRVFSRAVSLEEIGNDIYPPMKRELLRQQIPLKKHFAEQISKHDYDEADFIFYMDESNKIRLSHLINDYKNIVKPITLYNKEISYIEDPWYTDRFELVVKQLKICVKNIIENIYETESN